MTAGIEFADAARALSDQESNCVGGGARGSLSPQRQGQLTVSKSSGHDLSNLDMNWLIYGYSPPELDF
jgi:hypothetical protein